MHAKKLLSLLLSALAAVTLLASCGSRWDYSREAVKAANEAQGETLRVEFQVDQKFTNALHDAVEENIQPADVEKAMLADASLKELLTSGYRLNVYALRADVDAEEAARTIAEEQILPRLSGCKDEGVISMVKADNNYFYEAVLTYKESSSGGGGGHEPGKPEEPDPQPTMYKITVADYDTNLGTVTAPEGVKEGGSFTFTVEPGENADVTSVSVSGTCDFDEETYTVSNVQSDITITVEFKSEPLPVEWDATTGTLTFQKGASAAMGTTVIRSEDDVKNGLKQQDLRTGTNFSETMPFSLIKHLIIERDSGITEIKYWEDKNIGADADLSDGKAFIFFKNPSLETIDLSGVNSIGRGTFYGCKNLNSVKISSETDINIKRKSFASCTARVNVEIMSEGNITFGKQAFYAAINAGGFKEDAFSVKVKGNSIEIGEGVFETCVSLGDIVLDGKLISVGEDAFDRAGGNTGFIHIHCTGGEEVFKNACDGDLSYAGVGESRTEEIEYSIDGNV